MKIYRRLSLQEVCKWYIGCSFMLNILHAQYDSLPLLCINAFTRGKTTGLGKYDTLARVLYITLAQVLKLLFVLYNALARNYHARMHVRVSAHVPR